LTLQLAIKLLPLLLLLLLLRSASIHYYNVVFNFPTSAME
jgi:hypothetical protein